jgi:hypothetical protein
MELYLIYMQKLTKYYHNLVFCMDVTGLAGATADVHCYDVLSNKWTRYSVSEIFCILCNVVLRYYVLSFSFPNLLNPMPISACHISIYHLLVQFDHNVNVARLTPLGEPPSPRAAHVATAVGTMVVIQVPSLGVSIFLLDEC